VLRLHSHSPPRFDTDIWLTPGCRGRRQDL